MKTMVCEMCGGHDVVKAGGVYVCQHCGTKYDVEEARKLIVTIDGPVNVDGVATADNLMARAEEFYYKGDRAKALEYVNRVLDIDVHHARAREMQRVLENVPAPPRRTYQQHPVRLARVTTEASAKSKMVAFFLCLFFGVFGAHNFYVGKAGKGVLYFFTSGLFGLGWLWDMIQIARGKFTDKDGLPLSVG